MARVYGQEFPERRLMGLISGLLGLPHFTTGRGSTVRKDFLDAIAGVLDVDPQGLGKADVLLACIAAAKQRYRDPSYLSPGGTVTNEALQAIYDGLLSRGVAEGRPGRTSSPEQSANTIGGALETEAFDPAAVVDQRDHRLREVTQREGQDRFRTVVLAAYGQRCAMTDADVAAGLDAAHIVPYRGPETNRVPNGLALRADVHRLFDRGQIGVDALTMSVRVKHHLAATAYGRLEGRPLHLPARPADHPSPAALRHHWRWAGF